MASRERLCDYFTVVGAREGDIKNRVVPEPYSVGNLHRALEDAIVDICIINYPKDTIPFDDNYELLLKPDQADEGGEGGKVQLAKHRYLCFRRRKHNKTPSYISEIRIHRKGVEPLPPGFQLIEKTHSGDSANLAQHLCPAIYLAIKRITVNPHAFRFSMPPVLSDLCLCNSKKDGSAPIDYVVLPQQLVKFGNPDESIFLAYREGPRAGLCDIPYDAYTLESYPAENTYDEFPLPQNELPMFCFPRGLFLKHEKRDNAPMPTYFSFVFTSIDGNRVHVACLQFYELLPKHTLRSLEAKQHILTVAGSFSPSTNISGPSNELSEWEEDESCSSADDEEEVITDDEGHTGRRKGRKHHHNERKREEGGEDGAYGLFAPKCICVIAHHPFYRALRSFLQQIYRISLSPSPVPIERYIAYFTYYLPLPPPPPHVLHLHLDLGLADPVSSSSLQPITLRLPETRSLPLMDLDYSTPFHCLSIDNVLKIFVLLLMEERLLLISSSTSQLTETTETILTLLFPFEWLSCYIPRLPNKLTEILDAPGSFLIGMYLEGTTLDWKAPQLSDPIFIIDLDHDRIIDAEGKGDYVKAMEDLPLLESLREKLKGELDRVHITVQSADALREKDSAFELPAIPGAEGGEEGQPAKLEPDVIRDAFLVFMCDLIGGYTQFFSSQEGGNSQGASGGLLGAFDVPKFVDSVEKEARLLLEKLVTTQMFAALVQQRMEHGFGIDRLVFFETCVQELKERRAAELAAVERAKAKGLSPPKVQTGEKKLLIHSAVASIAKREGLLRQAAAGAKEGGGEALVVPPTLSPPSSPSSESAVHLPRTIIIPGPGADGCGPPGTRYSYAVFPSTLNKSWMTIPPSALPPVLLDILSKRKKYVKKGHRMMLARSVSECMKDWQAVGTQIGSNSQGRNKEIYLALQIFGIYFMCLPSRVSYKGRPLKIIMQAIGLLQFILDFTLERYMDEAMWRSILVACGRCGHASTRKIAISVFQIMRRAGISINALTYGQYTKALAEKDAVDVAGGGGAGEGRMEIDDSPWLEEKGQSWYTATCEPPPPETLKRSVADSFKSLLTKAAKPAPLERRKGEKGTAAEGELWTAELRDPTLSASNTTISSATMDSAGVIGMWVVCLCVHCEYQPLDEEIMTLRQDLLIIQAADDRTNHLLLCPKCQKPLTPRLYYDIKTFTEMPRARRPGALEEPSSSVQEAVDTPQEGEQQRDGDFIKRKDFYASVDGQQSSRMVRPLRSFGLQRAMRGEISGIGLGKTAGEHVDYLSPFTLRMRMEKLLLEHGEECLTRDWARRHHPELYWNLVWFTTRLSIPFPLLLDSLDAFPLESSPSPPSATSQAKPPQPPPLKKEDSSQNLRKAPSRQDSMERLAMYFHEIVVVGWEGEVVRSRCEKVETLLKSNGFARLIGTSRPSLAKAESSTLLSSSPTAAGAPQLTGLQALRASVSVRPIAAILPTVAMQDAHEAVGPLTIEELFPNISGSELRALQEVEKVLLLKGLKDALQQFLTMRHKQGGWTSEAALGSPYRVFLKLAANYRVRKLYSIVPVTNLMSNPGYEHEYTMAIGRIGDRFFREKAAKDEKLLLAELPRRDAIKFRAVFGHLY